ncbi:ABC transporter permease [Desulfopila aestuarii]|uniref:ABC-type transport system, involved in lipoprotein release, permease component n=1 Tax=Desulfopila aestuarii DSM 18488 TaxID=1121416 RepID=A0A1M7XZD2_9BACT|nr:ABC transporter permease [Desulfopila aestuarii]SHO44538.1 ABC-type transport system, involved in lipoprotein release, permease component [Desulfopila aestuarii DSM 18488]
MTLRQRLQRQLNLLDYALATLWRRKLKNFGIVVVFTVVVFLFGSLQLMNRGLTEAAEAILKGAPDITVQQMSAGRQVSLHQTAGEEIEKILGVAKVVPRIWGYHFDEANGANYTIVGMNHDGQLSPLAEGRYPETGSSGEVVISREVQKSLDLGSRLSFSLFRPDLSMKSCTTVGMFGTHTGPVTADTIFMTMADARDLFQLGPHLITDLLVYVANPREIDNIAGKIASKIPGSRVITRSQIMKTYNVVYSWRSGFGGICLLASLVAFVILAYDRASGLSREDLREMGILKILGWQVGEVMAVRFWESVVVSFTAFLLGYGFAWVHVVWWQGMLFQPLMLGWSVLRPEFRFVPSFVPADLLLLFSVSVLPYLAATVVPAWKSGMVRPDTVI